jgi:NAD(P)-dependent dehydrogenase (short-subunit alcohol dehydrogenase family)
MMTKEKRYTMNELKNKIALVTGGSRGIGRGIVETLTAQGAHVWALARDAERLETLKREVPGVDTIAADITDPGVAADALHEICPDILVLNAGAQPIMMPTHQMTWEQFNRVWETDVQSTFEFGKAALTMPMQPGSTVVIMSSGAAVGGSPLSGSYASAKRAQWFLAQYFQGESQNLNRGIRFVALVPRQIVGTTDLGHAAATHYAAQQGITKEAYLGRMGDTPLTSEGVGQGVVSLLTDQAYAEGIAFGINSQGLSALN